MKVEARFTIHGYATITVTAKTEDDAWEKAEDVLRDAYYGDVTMVEWQREGIERDGDTFHAKFFVEGSLSKVVTAAKNYEDSEIISKARAMLAKKPPKTGEFARFQNVDFNNYDVRKVEEDMVW